MIIGLKVWSGLELRLTKTESFLAGFLLKHLISDQNVCFFFSGLCVHQVLLDQTTRPTRALLVPLVTVQTSLTSPSASGVLLVLPVLEVPDYLQI